MATISKLLVANGWIYDGCPKCNKKLMERVRHFGAFVGDDHPGCTIIGSNNTIGYHAVIGVKCQDMKYKFASFIHSTANSTFVNTCKRLKIMKGSDAIGLGMYSRHSLILQLKGGMNRGRMGLFQDLFEIILWHLDILMRHEKS
ncbi:hypothetical protein JHK87_052442 [Glycine soja]|nr:hypothetical protein JHK87_052442 [Glycine soja]